MRYRPQRYPARTVVKVLHGAETYPAELTNISATGARLRVPARLPERSQVTLSYLGLRIAALVVWSGEGQIGLRFIAPIAPSELNALRGAVGGRADGWGTSGGFGFRELE